MDKKKDQKKYGLKKFGEYIKLIPDKLIELFFPTLIMLWYLFLSIQLLFTILENNFEIFFNYAEITLTLFGFTLLGTFYEHRHLKENELTEDDKKYIKRLVRINLLFLFTSVCFLFIYSFSKLLTLNIEDEYVKHFISIVFYIAFLIGVVGLSFGTWWLFEFLRDWYKKLIGD